MCPLARGSTKRVAKQQESLSLLFFLQCNHLPPNSAHTTNIIYNLFMARGMRYYRYVCGYVTENIKATFYTLSPYYSPTFFPSSKNREREKQYLSIRHLRLKSDSKRQDMLVGRHMFSFYFLCPAKLKASGFLSILRKNREYVCGRIV